MAAARISREIKLLKKDPVPGVEFEFDPDDLFFVIATLQGGKDTPYEGGVFTVTLKIPTTYPKDPPNVLFNTRIFHPNINERGVVCMNVLKKDWSPGYQLSSLMNFIIALLAAPNTEDPLNNEAARLYDDDVKNGTDKFNQRAKSETEIYATGT